MKNYLLLILLSTIGTMSTAQEDSTGLPGDNFSLQGALELFKQANSPEEFEKLLNTESNQVNNLDINNDGEIDYIRVVSKQDKDNHLFVLQVPVSESENQDIAVIELEKKGKDEANVQIIGDEDIFGEETIVEPSDGSAGEDTEEESGNGPSPYFYSSPQWVVINVWGWPCVRFVYAPAYVPWVSPWRWRVYPTWWRPWRPLRWAVWHPFRVRYHGPTVRVVHTHRCVHAHKVYTPTRVRSTTVRTHYAGAHKNYTVTRKKTTVTGPRGNKVTKKTTTVRGPHGNVKAKKTTVHKVRR